MGTQSEILFHEIFDVQKIVDEKRFTFYYWNLGGPVKKTTLYIPLHVILSFLTYLLLIYLNIINYLRVAFSLKSLMLFFYLDILVGLFPIFMDHLAFNVYNVVYKAAKRGKDRNCPASAFNPSPSSLENGMEDKII